MIKIRELVESDLEFLVEIRNECRNFLHNASEFSLEDCKEWFKNFSPKFYIIESDGTRIGYFRTSDWQQDSCWIGGDLHKDFRGKGLMKSSYFELFEHLRSLNVKTVFLSVLSFNEVAFNLYEKLGFQTTSITDFCQVGTNKITHSIQMAKDI